MRSTLWLTLCISVLMLSGCSDKENKESLTEGGMKCGPGKCGASMIDGSALLVKKKLNILQQMEQEDDRRECVLQAETTKALYACVRVAKTGRLSTKCSSDATKQPPKKEIPIMKCETGKCGSSME